MINVPELNYWANKILLSSKISDNFLQFPVKLSSTKWKSENSILSLLFNTFYTSNFYIKFFKRIPFKKLNDIILSSRLSLFINDIDIYAVDSDEYSSFFTTNDNPENLFEIDSEEEILLDKVLQFKTDSTSVVDISTITYGNLNSALSKMIFLYLNHELNNDYSLYNNEQSTFTNTNSKILHILYEKWLIDYFYRKQTKKYTIKNKSDHRLKNLIQKDVLVTLTNTNIINKQIIFSDLEIPFNSDEIEVFFKDEILIKGRNYNYELEPIARVHWENSTLVDTLQIGNIIKLSWSYLGT